MVTNANSTETSLLLQCVQATDRQALPALFARHKERLRQMVRLRLDRRLRGRFDSSSVLQQVYQDACGRLHEYLASPSQPFFLWLRLLAGQRILALHRQYLGDQAAKAAQEVTLYRGALPEANAASLAGQLLGQRSAGQAAQAALQVRLQDALNGMDPLDREILSLCHFEDLRNDEAATVLNLDRAAASNHYVRALKRLKEILASIPGLLENTRK